MKTALILMEHPVGFEPTMRGLQPRALDQTGRRTHIIGASVGIRTQDTLIKSQVLYLLSYTRIYKSLIPQPKFSLLEC